jgi:hypothetical protein
VQHHLAQRGDLGVDPGAPRAGIVAHGRPKKAVPTRIATAG